MKTDLKKPCRQCPFRRRSAPGFTGGAHPKEFIYDIQAEAPMPCHLTVDYEDKTSDEILEQYPEAQQCAGAAIFRSNSCKRPRSSDIMVLPTDKEEVFTFAHEFLEHHVGAWERVFGGE